MARSQDLRRLYRSKNVTDEVIRHRIRYLFVTNNKNNVGGKSQIWRDKTSQGYGTMKRVMGNAQAITK